MNIDHEVSLDVARAPGEVFAFLESPDNTPKWVAFCVTLKKVSDGPTAIGIRLHYTY